jgi:hypothetical protein
MTNKITENWAFDGIAYDSKFEAVKAMVLKEYGFKVELVIAEEESGDIFSYSGKKTDHNLIRECLISGSYNWTCGFIWTHTNQGQDYWRDRVMTPEKRRYLEWLLENTKHADYWW